MEKYCCLLRSCPRADASIVRQELRSTFLVAELAKKKQCFGHSFQNEKEMSRSWWNHCWELCLVHLPRENALLAAATANSTSAWCIVVRVRVTQVGNHCKKKLLFVMIIYLNTQIAESRKRQSAVLLVDVLKLSVPTSWSHDEDHYQKLCRGFILIVVLV